MGVKVDVYVHYAPGDGLKNLNDRSSFFIYPNCDKASACAKAAVLGS